MSLFKIAHKISERYDLNSEDIEMLNKYVNSCTDYEKYMSDDICSHKKVSEYIIPNEKIYKKDDTKVSFCGRDKDGNTIFVIYPHIDEKSKEIQKESGLHNRITIMLSNKGVNIMVRKTNHQNKEGSYKTLTLCNVYNMKKKRYLLEKELEYIRKKTKKNVDLFSTLEIAHRNTLGSLDNTMAYIVQRNTVSDEKEEKTKIVSFEKYCMLGCLYDYIEHKEITDEQKYTMVTSLFNNYKTLTKRYSEITEGKEKFHFDIGPKNVLVLDEKGNLKIFDPADFHGQSTYQPVFNGIKASFVTSHNTLAEKYRNDIGFVYDIVGMLICTSYIVDRTLCGYLNSIFVNSINHSINFDGTIENYEKKLKSLNIALEHICVKTQQSSKIDKQYYELIRGMIMMSVGLDPNVTQLPTASITFEYSFNVCSAWNFICGIMDGVCKLNNNKNKMLTSVLVPIGDEKPSPRHFTKPTESDNSYNSINKESIYENISCSLERNLEEIRKFNFGEVCNKTINNTPLSANSIFNEEKKEEEENVKEKLQLSANTLN